MYLAMLSVGWELRHRGQTKSSEVPLTSRCFLQHFEQTTCSQLWHAAGSSRNPVQMLQQKHAAGTKAPPQLAYASKSMPCSATLANTSIGRSSDIVGGFMSA